MKKKKKINFFENLANKVMIATGSTPAILIAFGLIIIWAATGPVFNYSETWQLVINTGTTIITFLMVFLIQKSQNKESLAVQLKLDEILASSEFASNRLVDVEDLTEDELKAIRKYYSKLKATAQNEESLRVSHSIEEAEHKLEKKIDETKNSRKKGQNKNTKSS